jgi:hypothetical protein
MKRKAVQQVVAYVWDLGGHTIEVPRQQFWPDCGIRIEGSRHWAMLNWDASPVYDVVGDHWQARQPDAELLECGHVLPMRTHRRGWYVRPGRRCILCAHGVEP